MSQVRPSSSSKKRRKSSTPEGRSKKSSSSSKSASKTAANSDGQPSDQQPATTKNTFVLPAEYDQDPERFQFWTVRIPSSISLKDVDGCQITVHPSESNKGDEQLDAQFTVNTSQGENHAADSSDTDDKKTSSSSKARTYTVSRGSEVENKSLRMMISAKQLEASKNNGSNDDDDDDDHERNHHEDNKPSRKVVQKLVPLSQGFAHHINVLEHHTSKGELELAPPHSENPSLAKGTVLKRAYTPVPQKTGLKRRWNPIGFVQQQADDTATTTTTTTDGMKEDNDSPSVKVKSPDQRHQSRKRKVQSLESDGYSNDEKTPVKSERNATATSAVASSSSTSTAPAEPKEERNGEVVESAKTKIKREEKKSAKKEKKAAKKLAKKEKKAAKRVKRES